MAADANGKRGAGLGTAFFIVLIVCGVLLVLLGGGDGQAAKEQPDPREQRLWEAYTSADEADRALTSNDFGEAQRHVRHIKDTLGTLVRQEDTE